MVHPPLDVSPLAVLLLDLAGRRATGRLSLGDRTLILRDGELADLVAYADESLEESAVRRGIADPLLLQRLGARAQREGTGLLQLLEAEGHITRDAIDELRRAVLCERLTRALVAAEMQGAPLPVLEPAPEASRGAAVELVSLVLDALAHDGTNHDAALVREQLNRRLEWNGNPHAEQAIRWAALGELPDRPAVSTILARMPDAGPRVAALLRSGVASLSQVGRATPSRPPRTGTLPPAPPRLSVVSSRPEPLTRTVEDPLAELSARPPRVRLDPGSAAAATNPLLPTVLTRLAPPTIQLDDPLAKVERRIAELEAVGASGRERARAAAELADLWRQRLGSSEQACRWFREAAAADPTDVRILEQAAQHCHEMGEPALAARYALAAVERSTVASERASAQRLRATVLHSVGDMDGFVEALCEAAADNPTDPEPHELVAAALLSRGNVDGANAHARLGAAAQIESAPRRAGALLDFAWSIKPADVPTAYEYASLLDSDGRRPAAVAVLAATAAESTDPDGRRRLRLAAAQRAEAAGRSDLAAELLAVAFDAEPHFDLLYAPLEEDLKGVETPELRAAILEDVATACPESQRAEWLTRAGKTTLEIEGQKEAACWLFYEAVLTDPSHAGALEALRTHAQSRRELTLHAHALRACIAHALGVGGEVGEVQAQLTELGQLAESALDNPELARAAWTQLDRLGHRSDGIEAKLERLADVCESRRDDLVEADAGLLGSAATGRGAVASEVLRLLPDLPENWRRRMALLSEVDMGAGLDTEQRDELETLHGLAREPAELASYLDDAAERTETSTERKRLLRRLAAVHTMREDTTAVAAAAERILAIDPGDATGHARLQRAARKLRDPERLKRALLLRLDGTDLADGIDGTGGVRRSRLHAQLARVSELLGRERDAADHARQALALDPGAADAALIYLRTAHRLDAPLALAGMPAVSIALGPSRRLYMLWMHAARAVGDEGALTEVAEAWARALPTDADARAADIAMRAASADAARAHRICEEALATMPCEEVVSATRFVIDRLAGRGDTLAATRLALRVAATQGHPDQAFAQTTVLLARRAGDASLITRALELQLSRADPSARAQILVDLAAHHRDFRDHVGEARALLRVLEIDAAHETALRQLEALFKASGDARRVAAVTTLALEAEADPEARRVRLLDLVALSGLELGDIDGADYHVRQLIAESTDDTRWLRAALGALLEIEDERAGLARCIAIADECPDALGQRIYLWCCVTAEERLGDTALACELAVRGTQRFPSHGELLLTVERLTLANGDAETTMSIYDGLIARSVGPHGRRALLYRAGRWLERADKLDAALERYLEAFRLEPAGGAALKAIERVARATDQMRPLLTCYEELAECASDAGSRVDLLCAAAELCGGLHEHERCLKLLMEANSLTEGFTLDGRVQGAARILATSNPGAARAAWKRVADELGERAENLWDTGQKVACLIVLSRILGHDLKDAEAALARLEEAGAALEGEEADDQLVARVALTRATILCGLGRPEEARGWLKVALEIDPELEGVHELSDELAGGEVSALSRSLQESADREPTSGGRIPQPAHARSEHELRTQLASGDERAVIPLSRALLGRPEAAAEARTLLRNACVAQPWNTAALRALHDASADAPSRAERWVVGTLLSIFDRRVECPPDLGVKPSFWREVDVRGLIGRPWAGELDGLLARLWECARSVQRFRNTPQELGIAERDRISRLTVGPVAEAYTLATRILGTDDIQVYASLNANGLASVLPTHPPSVVAARRVGASPAALRYAMARALWLAQPEFAIPAVLERADAVDLLDAATAAFGGRSGPERLSSAATDVAAGLWQALPVGEQRQLERVLLSQGDALDYETLHAAAMDSAARAALLASGALAEAVDFLARHDPALTALNVSVESDFARACQRSSALCTTLQCALSPDFLAAVRAALS